MRTSDIKPGTTKAVPWFGITVGLLLTVMLAFWTFWGRSLGWDEFEYARATAWVAHGRWPYVGFWEHHAPLQWYLMALWARLGPEAGAGAVLWLRALQNLAWVPLVWWWVRILRRERQRGALPIARMLLLALAATFVLWAVEYRPDTLATVGFAGALAGWRLLRWWRGALVAGALLALAILANLRVGPIALVLLLPMAVVSPRLRRWRVGPRLWLTAGGFGGVLALAGILQLFLGGWGPAWHALVRQNIWFNALIQKDITSFFSTLFRPLMEGDFAAATLLAAAVGLTFSNLRRWRRPDFRFVLGIAQALQLYTLAQLGIHYPYHLQGVLVLASLQLGLASCGWLRPSVQWGSLAMLAVNNLVFSFQAHTYGVLRLQRRFMDHLEAVVPKDQTVLDGVGYALGHEPSFRIWFMPTLARTLMANQGELAYTPQDVYANPPGAVVMTPRMMNWLKEWPDLVPVLASHYLPETPRLWLPGLSARLLPGAKATWKVPVDGVYVLVASPGLETHIWFKSPTAFFGYSASSPAAAPPEDPALLPAAILAWELEGRKVQLAEGRIKLSRKETLQVTNLSGHPVGLFLVPVERGILFQGLAGHANLDSDLFSIWGNR